MELQFPKTQLSRLAAKYAVPRQEEELLALRETVQAVGYLTKPQLRLLAYWKSPRSAGHVEKNSDSFIKEITRFALSSSDERARIEALTLLNGVLWPSASVVLHIFHADPYPILDFRALESLGTEVPNQYTFDFWFSYVGFCRRLAKQNRLTMRVLDRALWQHSKVGGA